MAKRFTDTNKYKKPFIRSLKGAYKLLWDYLYHDCDHAGIWIVDFDIAQIYIGADMPVLKEEALQYFNEDECRIIEFDKGNKWFIPSFIDFQYGELNENNRAHNSVILILNKNNLLNKNKPLTTPFKGCKDKDMDKDMDKDKEWTESNEKFRKFLCKEFGISEMKQPQNYFLITNAITLKQNQSKEQYEWFKGQCFIYFKYKEKSGEKKHGLKQFIGDLEEIDNGGWNNENWDKKLSELKRLDKVEPNTSVQPSKSKRIGQSSTIKQIKNTK